MKIVSGFLSWDEFKILTKDGNIEFLLIEKVVDSNGNMIAIEDACVPNLNELYSANIHVTQNSIKKKF
uniref:Uncharacterized protein n=1 Tax=Panagrolaimus sp. PS1159 TaxID=55785 RepID=A0AC35FBS7_9BILA